MWRGLSNVAREMQNHSGLIAPGVQELQEVALPRGGSQVGSGASWKFHSTTADHDKYIPLFGLVFELLIIK